MCSEYSAVFDRNLCELSWSNIKLSPLVRRDMFLLWPWHGYHYNMQYIQTSSNYKYIPNENNHVFLILKIATAELKQRELQLQCVQRDASLQTATSGAPLGRTKVLSHAESIPGKLMKVGQTRGAIYIYIFILYSIIYIYILLYYIILYCIILCYI